MKIAYILKRYPRLSETFIVNEIVAHEAAGLALEIVALRPVQETHFQNIISHVRSPVRYIPYKTTKLAHFWSDLRTCKQHFGSGFSKLMDENASAEDIAQALQLALLAQASGITHFHAHFGTLATNVARLASILSGIPYSFTAHAKDIYHEYAENFCFDLMVRDAKTVVTVSNFNQHYLQHTYPQSATIQRIYNGLDLSRFSWQPPTPNALEVLAVGRLVEKKGFDVLLQALYQLKQQGTPLKAVIVGGGEEEAKLRAMAERLSLHENLRFLGPRPQAEIIAMMRQASCLACPCVIGKDGNRDGLPTVLIEAMALGLPVISTDIVGIPELVQHERTGLLVPERDPEALAMALRRIYADEPLRASLSQAARTLIEQSFDIHQNTQQLRRIFQAN